MNRNNKKREGDHSITRPRRQVKQCFSCPSCNVLLPDCSSMKDVIEFHMIPNEKCRKTLFQCSNCEKHFISHPKFLQHINRTNDEGCRTVYNQRISSEAYTISSVEIKYNDKDISNNATNSNKSIYVEDSPMDTIHSTFISTKIYPKKLSKKIKTDI